MAYKNGIIQTETISQKNYGISIDDLKRCFQVKMSKVIDHKTEKRYSCDLGAIIKLIVGNKINGWEIESRQDINMWAKFKPVKSSNNFPINTSPTASSPKNTYPLLKDKSGGGKLPEWDTSLGFQWWRDTVDNNVTPCLYGIKPVKATMIERLLDQYLNGSEWTYFTPIGGDNYPYRILDFLNYNHLAPKPVGVNAPSRTIGLGNTNELAWSINVSMPQDEYATSDPINERDYLKPSDILKGSGTLAGWNNVYFGFALIKQDKTKFCMTTGTSISSTDIKGALGSVQSGERYYVMPFFTNKAIDFSWNTVDGENEFATVPYSTLGEVIFTSASILATFRLTASIVGNVIKLTAAISTDNAREFQYVRVYICARGTAGPDENEPSSRIHRFDLTEGTEKLSLPANSDWTQSMNYSIKDTDGSAFICYFYTDGKRRASAAPKTVDWEPPQLMGGESFSQY